MNFSKVKRWLLRRMLAMLIAYGLVVLGFTLAQRKLLYIPKRLDLATAETAATEAGVLPWKNAAGEIMGWKFPAIGPSAGSVLILHGNAGCALERGYLALPLQATRGLDVYVLEYPGYGPRPGQPSLDSLTAAADAAFQALPAAQPIYLVSESIGTGPAAWLAQKHPQAIAGMALFVPYASLADVAQYQMSFLPARLILWDRFQPAKWLQDYHGPVYIILAGQDRVIPPRFGQSLFDGYAGPKALQIQPEAGHENTAPATPEAWQPILDFWKQHAPVKTTPKE